MTRRALIVPALVLALSACSGDGGDSGSAGRDAPSPQEVKEAYVEQATGICEKADAEFRALTQPTTPEAFGPFVSETVRIAEDAQADLSALTPPEPDRAELSSKVLEPFEALVQDARAFSAKVAAAGTDSSKLLPLLSERPTASGIDLQYLRSYGLGVCADAISQAG